MKVLPPRVHIPLPPLLPIPLLLPPPPLLPIPLPLPPPLPPPLPHQARLVPQARPRPLPQAPPLPHTMFQMAVRHSLCSLSRSWPSWRLTRLDIWFQRSQGADEAIKICVCLFV